MGGDPRDRGRRTFFYQRLYVLVAQIYGVGYVYDHGYPGQYGRDDGIVCIL